MNFDAQAPQDAEWSSSSLYYATNYDNATSSSSSNNSEYVPQHPDRTYEGDYMCTYAAAEPSYETCTTYLPQQPQSAHAAVIEKGPLPPPPQAAVPPPFQGSTYCNYQQGSVVTPVITYAVSPGATMYTSCSSNSSNSSPYVYNMPTVYETPNMLKPASVAAAAAEVSSSRPAAHCGFTAIASPHNGYYSLHGHHSSPLSLTAQQPHQYQQYLQAQDALVSSFSLHPPPGPATSPFTLTGSVSPAPYQGQQSLRSQVFVPVSLGGPTPPKTNSGVRCVVYQDAKSSGNRKKILKLKKTPHEEQQHHTVAEQLKRDHENKENKEVEEEERSAYGNEAKRIKISDLVALESAADNNNNNNNNDNSGAEGPKNIVHSINLAAKVMTSGKKDEAKNQKADQSIEHIFERRKKTISKMCESIDKITEAK